MILYFSGTGNSEFVAKRIARETGAESLNLWERIRNHDRAALSADSPWILVVPTYAWRIPRIVENWLLETPLCGNRELYVIMTCGSEAGNAGFYAKRMCEKKGMIFRGCFSVVMPENYIAMFEAPGREEALEILTKAEPEIRKAAAYIKHGRDFPRPKAGLVDRLKSGPVNVLFYPLFVHSGKFRALETCISCGRCVTDCPLGNIRLEDGAPVWGENCTHCMACICRCPAGAIEYGKRSAGKVRYVCPEEEEERG